MKCANMLMVDNKGNETSLCTANSCGINVWWAKDCSKQWIIVFNKSHKGKKHLFDCSYVLAPALPNPAWLNTCTYVPWRRLIFSPHSGQAEKRKKERREKEGGRGWVGKTDQGG